MGQQRTRAEGRFAELAELPASELEACLRSGLPVDVDSLADTFEGGGGGSGGARASGTLWHGYALAMPSQLFKLFGRFGKTFVRDARGVRGWNVRMQQAGPDDERPWTAAVFRGRAVTYGHYRVIEEPEGAQAEAYPNAFLIDYGLGGNRAWDPLARVRDWVVALDDDLLVGRMFLSLGGRQVATPSYFALARGEPVVERVDPPVVTARD